MVWSNEKWQKPLNWSKTTFIKSTNLNEAFGAIKLEKPKIAQEDNDLFCTMEYDRYNTEI